VGDIPSLFTADSAANSPTYGGSIFYRNHTGTGQGNGISFALNNVSNSRVEYAYIGGIIESNTAGNVQNGAIIFCPTSNGDRLERMRIANDGDLTVGNGLNNEFIFQNDGTFEGGSGASSTIRLNYGGQTIARLANTGTGQRDAIFQLSDEDTIRVNISANNSRGGDTYFNGGGSVCINSTSPLDASAKLNVSGNVYLGLQPSGAGNSTLKYTTGTGLVSFDTSARIFKKDIVDLEYGLDVVLKMSPKKYKWKSNEYEDLGFIADEMYDIIPEIVALADNNINPTELKDGEPMAINYDRLVPVLVKAIQEQQSQIETLKSKIEILEQS
jgi:hypothetical protein